MLVEARSGGLCELCGQARGDHHHHRRPRAAGGSRRSDTNGAANLIALCAHCHLHRVESHRAWALVHGWLLQQHQVPARTPVLLAGRGWVRLDDAGGTEQYPDDSDAGGTTR